VTLVKRKLKPMLSMTRSSGDCRTAQDNAHLARLAAARISMELNFDLRNEN